MEDIERELVHYKEYFNNKIVYCNCDNPYQSNFYKFFKNNFKEFKLKELYATCIKQDSQEALKAKVTRQGSFIAPLKGNGDFRSDECIEILKKADIVCTNPPFSLFREYIQQLLKYNKKFLILGYITAITYNTVFPEIKKNKIWFGYNNQTKAFLTPKKENSKKITTYWYTNLGIPRYSPKIHLYKKYNPQDYPQYDNFPAIEVSKTRDIPTNYLGIMGVPISFLIKYNPEQFEIVGGTRGGGQDKNGIYHRKLYLNGKEVFSRIFIKHKQSLSIYTPNGNSNR